MVVVFVPVSVEEMKPLTFVCGPAVVTVTVTGISQDAPAASEPPVKEIVSGAVVVSEPPQTAVGPLVATVTPAGRESVKARPVNPTVVFGLAIVKVSVDAPPTATGSGAKDLVRVGWSGVPQPVMIMLSTSRSALVFVAPLAVIRK